jgi:hypothetical protein
MILLYGGICVEQDALAAKQQDAPTDRGASPLFEFPLVPWRK